MIKLSAYYLKRAELGFNIGKNLKNFVIVNFKNKILVSDLENLDNLRSIQEIKGKENFKIYVFKDEDIEKVKSIIS